MLGILFFTASDRTTVAVAVAAGPTTTAAATAGTTSTVASMAGLLLLPHGLL